MAKATKNKKPNKVRLEYRYGGRWIPIAPFDSKVAAAAYAKHSYPCQLYGWHVVPFHG